MQRVYIMAENFEETTRILRGTREAVETRIDDEFVQIRDSVQDQIQRAEEDGKCELMYELPYSFRDTCGVPIEKFKIIVYGKVIENLEAQEDDFDIKFIPGSPAFLKVQWKPVLNLENFDRCLNILRAHSARQ